MLSERS